MLDHQVEDDVAPVRAALIGVGEFGRSLLARAGRLGALSIPVVCDRDVARARATLLELGHPVDGVAICETSAAAHAAAARGQMVLVPDAGVIMDLPVEVVVEATGEPEVAARNAAAAIDHGKHVAMITKEADGVVGPVLGHRAARAGVVHTPVDGDQPSLLIRLVVWTRALALEIVAAGKSSEYDFVYDPVARTVTVDERTVPAPGLAELWPLAPGRLGPQLQARAEALAVLPQRTTPDYCEMAIVANATGLRPDRADFHAPILRQVEVADAFAPAGYGGLLASTGVVDVFNCLRRPDEASFAGGVFVVVHCDDRPTWEMLRAKGHPVSADGCHAMLYHPAHLLGVEAPRSIIEAARAVRGSAEGTRPVVDLVARTTRPLAAGTVLELGERHTIAGLQPLVVDAGPVAEGRPLPYYMAAGRRLRQDVPAGTMLTLEHVAPPTDSALWALRREQDRLFHRRDEGAPSPP